MANIFASYSRADIVFIEKLFELIKLARPQDDTWYDADITGGEYWWKTILEEIGKCDLFIYLISNESLESPYCQAELREALRLNKHILPVIVRTLKPTYPGKIAKDLQPVLVKVQYIDMAKGFKDEKTNAKLWGAINKLLNTPPQQAIDTSITKPIAVPSVIDKPHGKFGFSHSAAMLVLLIFIVVGFGLVFLPDNTILASTPESSQIPPVTTENQAPESSPTAIVLQPVEESQTPETPGLNPTSTASQAINVPLSKCSIDDLSTDSNTELIFFIDEDSLVLYLNADQPDTDLSQLGFEYSIDGERAYVCLQDFFDFLENTPLSSPTCLRLMRENSEPILPQACPDVVDFEISDEDVFWFGIQQHSFLILNEGNQVDFCGTARNSICEISLSSQPPPTDEDISIRLIWERDYLAIYVEDNVGLINLEGLRIAPNPENTVSLLQTEIAFASLDFNRIPSPVCFIFSRTDNFTAPPRGCLANRMIVQQVADWEVFWYVDNRSIPLFVLVDGMQIGNICVNSAPCTRQIPQPDLEE
jgi:TIR domain